jgi:hypothetical protein
MTNESLQDTQDMGLAVALRCKGFNLSTLEQPATGKRITFRFEASQGLDEAAQAYWNGNLMVDAKTYWNESKSLKARLYGTR